MRPLFGKAKQLKLLERKLTAARMSFGMMARLPEKNQRHLLDAAPREIAQAVEGAVRAGHGAAAKQMLDDAARQLPNGISAEQWQTALAAGFSALR